MTETKQRTIAIRVTEDMFQRIRERAVSENRSVSNLIVTVLDKELRTKKEDK